MAISSEVYTVPDCILFRNVAVLNAGQTRTLLIKNTSEHHYHGIVSLPFTPNFKLDEASSSQEGIQAYLNIDLPANSSAKLVVELCTTEDGTPCFQDCLVAVFGPHVLHVPIKAVRQSMDPASGAALQELVSHLPCSPSHQELEQLCQQFLESQGCGHRATHGQAPQPTAGSTDRGRSQQAADNPAAAISTKTSAGTISTGEQLPGERHSSGSHAEVPGGAHGGRQDRSSGSGLGQQELPPDGFSQQPGVEESLDDPSIPVIFSKPVVVQGRTAVAMAKPSRPLVAPSSSAPEPAPLPSAAPPTIQCTPPGVAGASPAKRPHSGQASRQSSASSAISRQASYLAEEGSACGLPSAGSSAVLALGAAGVGVQGSGGSAGPKYAFLLNGRYYNARGEEIGAMGGAGVVDEMVRFTHHVVDCGVRPPLHRSGSRPLSRESNACGSPVSLSPLKHPAYQHSGGAGFTPPSALLARSLSGKTAAAYLKPNTTNGTNTTQPTQLPHSSTAAAAPAGLGVHPDPMRAAAVAAAMRELGLSNIPVPCKPIKGQATVGPSESPSHTSPLHISSLTSNSASPSKLGLGGPAHRQTPASLTRAGSMTSAGREVGGQGSIPTSTSTSRASQRVTSAGSASGSSRGGSTSGTSTNNANGISISRRPSSGNEPSKPFTLGPGSSAAPHRTPQATSNSNNNAIVGDQPSTSYRAPRTKAGSRRSSSTSNTSSTSRPQSAASDLDLEDDIEARLQQHINSSLALTNGLGTAPSTTNNSTSSSSNSKSNSRTRPGSGQLSNTGRSSGRGSEWAGSQKQEQQQQQQQHRHPRASNTGSISSRAMDDDGDGLNDDIELQIARQIEGVLPPAKGHGGKPLSNHTNASPAKPKPGHKPSPASSSSSSTAAAERSKASPAVKFSCGVTAATPSAASKAVAAAKHGPQRGPASAPKGTTTPGVVQQAKQIRAPAPVAPAAAAPGRPTKAELVRMQAAWDALG